MSRDLDGYLAALRQPDDVYVGDTVLADVEAWTGAAYVELGDCYLALAGMRTAALEAWATAALGEATDLLARLEATEARFHRTSAETRTWCDEGTDAVVVPDPPVVPVRARHAAPSLTTRMREFVTARTRRSA